MVPLILLEVTLVPRSGQAPTDRDFLFDYSDDWKVIWEGNIFLNRVQNFLQFWTVELEAIFWAAGVWDPSLSNGMLKLLKMATEFQLSQQLW